MAVRDGADHLDASVTSVLAQAYEGGLDMVIAVGPSADGTEIEAQRLADTDRRVSVVPNPSGATAAGLNRALERATGEVVVRVDAHCELPPAYVSTAVTTLGETRAANVGGIQSAEGTTPYERAVAAAMSSRFGVGDARFHYGGRPGEVDTVYLGVFDAAALQDVGGFDESLVRNQDYELNWRLRESGRMVWFNPNLVVRYRPRGSVRSLASQYFQYGQWKREVLRRHPKSLKARQVVAPLTLVGVSIGLAGAALGQVWMLAAPATYALAVVGAAANIADSPAQALRLASVFPTMHLSWGAGFLLGPPRSTTVGRETATLEPS